MAVERQDLEYKLMIHRRDDEEKLEFLEDVVAMANGGGGYILVGIRDDGHGRPHHVEGVSDSDDMIRSIHALCHEHISPPIQGLEVRKRSTHAKDLVVMRVPVSSGIPHMVTYSNRTCFMRRHGDSKRAMSLEEIRAAFTDHWMGRRLDRIDAQLRMLVNEKDVRARRERISSYLEEDEERPWQSIEDGLELTGLARIRFEMQASTSPYYWIAATPTNPTPHFFGVDAPSLRRILDEPPGSRPEGWSMSWPGTTERFVNGLRRGDPELWYLELHQTGHLEFRAPLGELFCWGQSEAEFKKRPTLNPYPVAEYPTSFLRLYRALIDLAGGSSDILVQYQYRNLGGYVLRPYRPGQMGYDMSVTPIHAFSRKHFVFPPEEIPAGFNADVIAFGLVKQLYATFGYDPHQIPFYSDNEGFVFE